MEQVDVARIWVSAEGRLCVRLADESLHLTHIYRASASGVDWDPQTRAVCSPVPREWSLADWFLRIVEDARDEYGIDLVLTDVTEWRDISGEARRSIESARRQMPAYQAKTVDPRTMARYVGDDDRRREARVLFEKEEWARVVAALEAVKYPQFLERADLRRLELARKRAGAQ